jgi:hypothetical protein
MIVARHYCVAVFLLLTLMNQSAKAATGKNSFSKSVQQAGTIFDITSRTAIDCAVHIITVNVRRGGKKIAALRADVDFLPRSARAVDLNGDGVPELVLLSQTPGGADTLDVYWLDGTALRRATAPEPDEKSGYKGGGQFHLEERLIVHTVPVYRDGDSPGQPSGGTRALKYDFKNGAFALYVQTENAANVAESTAKTTDARPQATSSKTANPSAAGVAVTEIAATETGIDVKTSGAVAKYRTMRLDKPERLAIDIPGADSPLAGRKTAINRFGVSTVRVGRNKGFLRIVLDTTYARLPKWEITTSDNSMHIEFAP